MANRKPKPADGAEWCWGNPSHTKRTVRWIVNDEFGVDLEEKRWGRRTYSDDEIAPLWSRAIDAMPAGRDAIRNAVCKAFRALQRRRLGKR